MATAKLHDGVAIVAYRDGTAIDSEGAVIPGAPKPPKDTDPKDQAGAVGGLTSEERIGLAIATAMTNPQALIAKAQAAAGASEDTDATDGELPTLDEMPATLEAITDLDELKAMKRKDTRKGGKELIQARIDALKSAE